MVSNGLSCPWISRHFLVTVLELAKPFWLQQFHVIMSLSLQENMKSEVASHPCGSEHED